MLEDYVMERADYAKIKKGSKRKMKNYDEEYEQFEESFDFEYAYDDYSQNAPCDNTGICAG